MTSSARYTGPIIRTLYPGPSQAAPGLTPHTAPTAPVQHFSPGFTPQIAPPPAPTAPAFNVATAQRSAQAPAPATALNTGPMPSGPGFNAAAAQRQGQSLTRVFDPATGQSKPMDMWKAQNLTAQQESVQAQQPQAPRKSASVVPGMQDLYQTRPSLPPGQRAAVEPSASRKGPAWTAESERVLSTEVTPFAAPTHAGPTQTYGDPNAAPVQVVGPQTDPSFYAAHTPAAPTPPAPRPAQGNNAMAWVALATAAITLLRALR